MTFPIFARLQGIQDNQVFCGSRQSQFRQIAKAFFSPALAMVTVRNLEEAPRRDLETFGRCYELTKSELRVVGAIIEKHGVLEAARGQLSGALLHVPGDVVMTAFVGRARPHTTMMEIDARGARTRSPLAAA